MSGRLQGSGGDRCDDVTAEVTARRSTRFRGNTRTVWKTVGAVKLDSPAVIAGHQKIHT